MSSNPRGSTQQLSSSKPIQRSTRRRSSNVGTDQLQSNMDAVAVVERVVTVVMEKLHPPVTISESVDSFARLIAMRDQARISGDHVTEQYATAMLQKLANEANASD